MTCPHCQSQIAAGARFCPVCGKATSATESDTKIPVGAVAPPDMIGHTIAGRYRILAKLGEGGMGAVYRGEQISLKRVCAVKLLRPELSQNQALMRRFNAEAAAVAKLSHPNTVTVYDFGQDTDGSLFIAMEFIEGRALRSALQTEGPFPPARAVAIALQVAASLADAHAHSIVHRDLKPDNVMLQDRGRQRDVVRVLDFGIAKLRDDSRATQQAMTQAGDMLGTPQYMAPEQIRGEQIDGRTDIYALGCLLYEMVTARLPFDAPTIMAMLSKHLLEQPVPPSQRRPDLAIPPAIDQVVMLAMAKDPAARPATMDAFAEMLQGVLATLPAVGQGNTSGMMAPASPVYGQFATPPAHSAYGGATPPTPLPHVGAGMAASGMPPVSVPSTTPSPVGYAAPPVPTGSATPAPPSRGGNIAMFTIIGLVVLGGGGAAAYFALRKPDKPPAPAPAPTPGSDETPHHDDWPPAVDAGVAPGPTKDPWAPHDDGASVPSKQSVGTALTPIPSGATVRLPSSFRKTQSNRDGITWEDDRDVYVYLAPLMAGTNDPEKLAQIYVQRTGLTLTGKQQLMSAGALREGFGFAGTADGETVVQIAATYITPRYRLGVIVQAPASMYAESDFQQEVVSIFANDVVMP